MLELLFLLLPIAAAYGWYMGHRSAKKDQEDISNKLSRDYVTGVNFLLSNQTDKAVDLFLDMLQKQETENEIESNSQFEAELTLGNLFRSRGEVDRALRIHQALDRSPNYSFEQKLLAKQQLAKDFMTVGFYDRAEALYTIMVDEPEFAENALQQLLVIYQKTKEWKKAVNIAEKLAKISPKENPIYIGEVLKTLKYCYDELGERDNFELFLIRASQQINNTKVDLMLASVIEEKDGKSAAQSKLYQQLTKHPSTSIFHRFIQFQIDDAEEGRGKESLILLHKMVGERIKQSFGYRCSNCGYQTHKLMWNCPSCKQWESIKPEHN